MYRLNKMEARTLSWARRNCALFVFKCDVDLPVLYEFNKAMAFNELIEFLFKYPLVDCHTELRSTRATYFHIVLPCVLLTAKIALI